MRKNAISCCLQFKNNTQEFFLYGFRTNPERIHSCGPATLSPNRTMLVLQLSAPLFSPVKERHISQTHYLWLSTGLLNRNITDTLQIHSMHLSTLVRERLLSCNDSKFLFLPWSETSAERITIRVQRGPRSVKKKHSFPMSIVGNELKMLWAVMQDGKSLKAGVDEANSGVKWWTGSDYKTDVLVIWACLIPLHSCLTYTHWSEHELYHCEGLTVRDSISVIHW